MAAETQARDPSGELVEIEITRPPNGRLQTVYCDAAIQVGIGPFTSRIMFGTQTGERQMTPEFQIVIPSNALLNMAQQILSMLSQDDSQAQFAATYEGFSQALSIAKVPS